MQKNSPCWIKLTSKKQHKDAPMQIQVDYDGTVYIDGELYNQDTSTYGNLTVDVENHNKMNSGEETQKIIDSYKTAKKGETVTIKDIKGPDKTEVTTVKF